jgi:acyl CoA:acetate/3-ketoacid CoA transferase alpha subunit
MEHPITSKKLKTIEEAMSLIKSGDRIMVSGFGNSGDPKQLVAALSRRPIKDLTIISNDLGSPGIGLGALLTAGMVKIGVELVPQGSFAEGIRAAGVGVAAFYTPTAAGTELSKGKDEREFNGRKYILQEAIKADVALISAARADALGNLVYHKTARNFNPLMAMAADLVIAEVGEIVPAGTFDPECIATPHIFVDVLVRRG